jgi:TonB family protein
VQTCRKSFTSAALWLVFWTALIAPTLSFAQQEETPARKVVSRVVPTYPDMARTMNLKGSVRLDALVAPNGTVKTVQIRGGHPVLAQAAESAIRKWKWQPAAHETLEPIEFKFDPR